MVRLGSKDFLQDRLFRCVQRGLTGGTQIAWMRLMTAKPLSLLSSLLLLPLLMWSASARADISNFTFVGFEGVGNLRGQLSSRLGTTLNSTEHYINIDDCERYAGGEMEVKLRIDPLPSGSWQYAVAYAPPSKTCSTTTVNPEASEGTCYVPAAQRELTQTNISFNVSFDRLMGSECQANTEGEASIYLIIQEPSLSQISFQRVIVNVDLRAPVTPTLDKVTGGDERFTAAWSDTSNDSKTKYVVYWSDAPFGEDDLEDVDSRTDITAKSVAIESKLSNDVTYYVSVAARDKAENESALSTQMEVTPSSTIDFWEAYIGAGGGEGGDFCFIATVSYGTSMDANLTTLRGFRDHVLMSSAWGRSFVESYYNYGRFAAVWIADKPVLQAVARTLLVPVVFFAELALSWGLLPASLCALLVLALSVVTFRKGLAFIFARLDARHHALRQASEGR